MKKYIFILFFSIPYLFTLAQQKWSLEQCLEYAEKNNLQVISSKYSKELQQHNLLIAKKDFLPSVAGSLSNSISFGQTKGFHGGIGRNDNFNNNISVSTNILLYSGGKLRNKVKLNKYTFEATKYDVESTQNNIALQIIQQYLNILLNKEIVKLRESSLKNTQELYKKAKITTEVGETAKTTLMEAQSTLAREKQNLKNAEINVKRSLFDLALLLQLKKYKSFDIEEISLENDIPLINDINEDNLNNIIAKQPQIKAAKARIKAAQAQIEVSKSAYYPSVMAGVSLGSFYFNSLVTDRIGIDSKGNIIKEKGFFKQYKTNFSQSVSLSVNIPIFNKGINKLKEQQSKINELIAKNNLSQEKQLLLKNIQKAQFDKESNYEVYISAQEAEKSTELALDYTEKSYKAGRVSIYDYNIANNNYINAQEVTLQAKYNYYFSEKVLEFYIKAK